MTHIAMSPNAREILSAKSTITGRQEYLTSTAGVLNINGSIGGSPLPISGATTGVGVAILDTSGNQISSFGGGTQYTDGGIPPAHPIGGTIEWSDGANWQTVSTAKPLPIAIVSGAASGGTSSSFSAAFPSSGTAIGATDGTNMQPLKVDGSDNLLVKVNTALPAGTNVIGHVISDTGSTTAVTGTVTVSGTVTTTPPSNASTNIAQINGVTPLMGNGVTGTGSQRVTIASDNTAFAVNATLSAETTKVIGTVNQGTSPWVVSGTVTANAGTNLNTSLLAVESGGNLASIKTNVDNLNLTIGSTTSGQKGNLVLGATTTAAPTYTTAQSNPLSLTTGGLLRVDGSGVTQPVSLTSTTVTGTVAVTQSTSPWVVGQSTAANLNATVVGTGTFAVQAAQSGTWNITNISGTVSLPTGASTEATLAKLPLAQASTTSGQSGALVQGAVTTGAPTYTTAQTSPLSLDTAGNLRTTTTLGAGSAVIGHVITDTGSTTAVTGTVTVSGTVTANAGTNLNTSLLALESGGNLATVASVVRAEDSASADADKGIGALAIRKASPGNTSGTDGDYEYLQMNAGRLWASATIDTALPAGTNVIGHTIIDTGSTTAVTQATAANLNATVVGTGTFVTQSTLAAETTKVIGVVRTADGSGNLLTSTSNALDVNLKTSALSNLSTNVAQINGVTPLMGNGTTGTGSQRVTIASDNTAFSVNANQGTAAALSAGWVAINGEQSDTTGTFTNATQTNSVTATNLAGYGNVLISINGTYGTATAVFEGSDDGGTTWYTVNEASRTDSSVVEGGYTTLTNTTRAWQTNNPGWDSLRVRSTAVASGTVNVRISPSAAPSAAGATVTLGAALPAGANVIGHVIADSGSTTAVTGTVAVTESGTWNVGSSSATGSAVPANAFYNGVNAATALPTAATPGNLTGLTGDKFGRVIMIPQGMRDIQGTQVTTITSTTGATTVVTAGAAGIFTDIESITFTNSSASSTVLTLSDGTVSYTYICPAGDLRGVSFQVPLKATTAATAWTVACTTSVASIFVNVQFINNK